MPLAYFTFVNKLSSSNCNLCFTKAYDLWFIHYSILWGWIHTGLHLQAMYVACWLYSMLSYGHVHTVHWASVPYVHRKAWDVIEQATRPADFILCEPSFNIWWIKWIVHKKQGVLFRYNMVFITFLNVYI